MSDKGIDLLLYFYGTVIDSREVYCKSEYGLINLKIRSKNVNINRY